MEEKFNNEIERMKNLISYGKNESKQSSCGNVVEYKTLGADGKTYGILREGTKFYIMQAPKKDTEVLAEDFDYIGGIMNKKQYEYNSYPMASKQLDLKLMSINEAYEASKKPVEQYNFTHDAEWQIEETKEMRGELDRFNQILENVSSIMKDGPKTGNAKNHMAPFTEVSTADGTKDLKAKEDDPKKAGNPFSVGGTVTNEMLESDKKPTKNGGTETYTEDVKEKDGGVAAEHPKKGKAVKFNESKGRTFKLTEEQAIALVRMIDDDDTVDTATDTEIGSSEPYCEESECNEEASEYIIDIEDGIGGDSTGDAEEYTEPYEECTGTACEEIHESELHDFGKHPAYRKKPMTVPPVNGAKNFGREWDDDSVKGDEPFGMSKGNPAPYTEDIVNLITDSIMSQLFKKKI